MPSIRAAVSGWLGTALEFMDFQLYSLGAALVFHEIFFPESSTAMALILAMGTYGAGYVARIVGAFIFGKMGDRIGRKKVLFITITMMGICTTLIGVLPTYAQIGVFAPILLGMSPLDAALLGSVMAAVSPAVVVPRMVNLIDKGYGSKKSIPQLILAGASLDDIVVIVFFTSAHEGSRNAFHSVTKSKASASSAASYMSLQ